MPSYTHWTTDEISQLSKLYQMDFTFEEMSRALDRSPRAIEHALKNLLTQDLIRTSSRKVMRKYNLTPEVLQNDLVPAKYYIPGEKSAFVIVLSVLVLYVLIVGIGWIVARE